VVGALDAAVSEHSSGISLISKESPMIQQIAKVGAIAAAGMVGFASAGEAEVRSFRAWISDAATWRWTFVGMFRLRVAPRHSARCWSRICARQAALTVSGLKAITGVMFLSVLLAALVSPPWALKP
jgi:hypothetical protein